MNLPGVAFAVLIATAAGLFFHLIRGGSLGRMILHVLAAWTGFAAGHNLANLFGWHWIRLGPLNLLPGLLAALLALILASVLAGPEAEAPSRPGQRKRPSR